MKAAQDRVRRWMKAVGQPTPERPLVNCHNAEMALFRRSLHREEAVDEFFEAAKRGHIVGIADALADSLVVILGTACAYGIEIEPIFDEVMRSNDSKLKGMVKRADGKVLKGLAYAPPDLYPIIARQLRYGTLGSLKGEKLGVKDKKRVAGKLGGKDCKLGNGLPRQKRKESL